MTVTKYVDVMSVGGPGKRHVYLLLHVGGPDNSRVVVVHISKRRCICLREEEYCFVRDC